MRHDAQHIGLARYRPAKGLRLSLGQRGDTVHEHINLMVFAGALCFQLRALLGHDLREVIPAAAISERASTGRGADHSKSDRRFAVWLVARNAKTWVSDPRALFDA